MISRLRGRSVGLTDDGLVLEVGGVGLRLHATPSAVRKAADADEAVLETHLHVRDDALQLFGFATTGERELFEQLLSVSGVGPRVALAIVSAYSPVELTSAISREDAALLVSIPGIGKKLAQRVVLELKERIGAADLAPAAGAVRGEHVIARDALVGLGFTVAEAEQRLKSVDDGLSVEDRVKEALQTA